MGCSCTITLKKGAHVYHDANVDYVGHFVFNFSFKIQIERKFFFALEKAKLK